jgi:AbrB family looped-hinge helix DNA binding protein
VRNGGAVNDREFSVRLSRKGQLFIPREIRDRHGWVEGVELVLSDQDDCVVLRSMRRFPETTLEELVGCTGYKGPALTLEEMEAGIARV